MLLPPARREDNGKTHLTPLRGITEGISRFRTEKRVKFFLAARNSSKVTYPQYHSLEASERRTMRIPDEKFKRYRTVSRSRLQYNQSHLFCNNISTVRRILLVSSPSVLKISLSLFSLCKIKCYCYNSLSSGLLLTVTYTVSLFYNSNF